MRRTSPSHEDPIGLPFALVRGSARVYDADGELISEFHAPILITKSPTELALLDDVHTKGR
jgi:hypothetical protein